MISPTPVTVLTGFLGAGKTTLLNRILRNDHGLRIGVMVNDFGDVNIDARLVSGMEGDAIDLTNGCVCCTMRGGLISSTRRLLERPNPPEYVVLEASGIADPIAIAATFRLPALRAITTLDGIITLVDAEHARDPRLDRQLVEDQIRAADIVVLNKIDLVDEGQPAALRAWVRDLVPGARIVEAVRAEVSLDVVLGVRDAGAGRPDAAPTPDGMVEGSVAGRGSYGTWTYRTDRPLAYRRVQAALAALPAGIFRAKGILQLADAPLMRFTAQVVGRRVTVDVHGPWGDESPGTELVFIGEKAALTAADLTARFDACVTDAIPLMPAFQRRQTAS